MSKKSTFLEEALERIDVAKNGEDWLSGFANAVTYFEFFGYWRLRWYCIKNGINLKQKLKNLHVSTLTLVLYLLKEIDENTYTKMNKIVKERNKLIHPSRAGITYRDRKEKRRATELLEEAKFCLKRLKEVIGHE